MQRIEFIVLILVIIAGLAVTGPWGADDAYISFTYSKDFTFNGENSIGWTSLVWIFLGWIARTVGIHPMDLAHAVNIVSLFGGLYLLGCWLQLNGEMEHAFEYSLLYLLPVQFLHVWSGMETVFFGTVLLGCFISWSLVSPWFPFLISLACITRPEGILVLLYFFINTLIRKENLKIYIMPAVTLILLLLFLLWRYGSLSWNVLSVKGTYVDVSTIWIILPVIILTVFDQIYIKPVILFCLIAGYLSSPEILMNYWGRLWWPFWFIPTGAASDIFKKYKNMRTIILIAFIVITPIQGKKVINHVKNHREMIGVLEEIGEHSQKYKTIVALDVGALGYYSGARIIDLVGLVDREIAAGKVNVVDYVFKQDPDAFIIPSTRPDRIQYQRFHVPEIMKDPRLKEHYSIKKIWKAGDRYYWEIAK